MKAVLSLLLILLPLGAIPQDKGKFKLNPTPDPSSASKVYIPKDLEDAFVELKKMLHPEIIKEMAAGAEERMVGYHMGLGLWMRNNWRLWAGSRLAEYFNRLGIFHPDDMSGIILDSFWRHLNSKPLELQKQVAFYHKYWQVNAEPKPRRCPYDGSLIEITMSLDHSEGDQLRTIHAGRCKRKKHLWAYEYDKGWYRPNAELRREIDQ